MTELSIDLLSTATHWQGSVGRADRASTYRSGKAFCYWRLHVKNAPYEWYALTMEKVSENGDRCYGFDLGPLYPQREPSLKRPSIWTTDVTVRQVCGWEKVIFEKPEQAEALMSLIAKMIVEGSVSMTSVPGTSWITNTLAKAALR